MVCEHSWIKKKIINQSFSTDIYMHVNEKKISLNLNIYFYEDSFVHSFITFHLLQLPVMVCLYLNQIFMNMTQINLYLFLVDT